MRSVILQDLTDASARAAASDLLGTLLHDTDWCAFYCHPPAKEKPCFEKLEPSCVAAQRRLKRAKSAAVVLEKVDSAVPMALSSYSGHKTSQKISMLTHHEEKSILPNVIIGTRVSWNNGVY